MTRDLSVVETAQAAPLLSLRSAALFVLSALLQIAGISLWPLTEGFTRPLPTAGAILAQLVAIGLLCRLIERGAPLSSLVPLASAMVPLVVIGIEVVVLGAAVSFAKVALLSGACVLIGAAR